MGWGTKKAATPQPEKPQRMLAVLVEDDAQAIRVMAAADTVLREGPSNEPAEPEPPKDKPTEAARAQLAWHKFKSSKGYTPETVAMLMHEFIASRGMFADLVKFVGRK